MVGGISNRDNPFAGHDEASIVRCFSWEGHGTDLLSDSLAHNYGTPKLILQGHSSTGFDIQNSIKNMDPEDQELQKSKGVVHMAGSILAFPGACFMWNVRKPEDLTVESLGIARLHRPKLEYLFIGSAVQIHPSVIEQLRRELAAENSGLVIEPMDLVSTGRKDRENVVSSDVVYRLSSPPLTSVFWGIAVTRQANAMGTFNILNGEDRMVAAALILPESENEK